MTPRRCRGDRYEFHMVPGCGVPKTWVCSCTARGWGWPKPHWQATVATTSFFTKLYVDQAVQAYRDAGADV